MALVASRAFQGNAKLAIDMTFEFTIDINGDVEEETFIRGLKHFDDT
jgi:hypothetical protein